MSQYVSLPVFIASFIIGLIFIYCWGPEQQSIPVYPSPSTYSKLQYKDKVGQCFELKPTETECPLF